jgi:hypothetical protein
MVIKQGYYGLALLTEMKAEDVKALVKQSNSVHKQELAGPELMADLHSLTLGKGIFLQALV